MSATVLVTIMLRVGRDVSWCCLCLVNIVYGRQGIVNQSKCVCVANTVNTEQVPVCGKSAILRRVTGGSKCVILLVVKHEAGVDWAGM